jgi:putative FmdB family regulatory protein
MPIHEYRAADPENACQYCRNGFERLEKLNAPPLMKCERCGAEVARLISAPRVGASRSGADDRAKHAGFHKLKKISKGEYEKVY